MPFRSILGYDCGDDIKKAMTILLCDKCGLGHRQQAVEENMKQRINGTKGGNMKLSFSFSKKEALQLQGAFKKNIGISYQQFVN